MKTNLFSALAVKIKRLTSMFREHPQAEVDDYVLEHFLLYNGLVGTTPDNQRQFRDLRADVIEAVNHNSAQELAIALKVAPLCWEDRLEKIFTEIAEVNRQGAVTCLLPESSDQTLAPEHMPLRYSDWRTRANAARMLAFLKATEAVPALIDCLNSDEPVMRPAFCHFAHSLGRLRTEESKQALIRHLHNKEAWFRVDAAAALANWALPVMAEDLMRGAIDYHQLQDYGAVAIARKHTPLSLLEYSSPGSVIESGACEVLLALLKAIDGPFHSDSTLPPLVAECQKKINEIAKTTPTPRTLNTAITVNLWLDDQGLSAPGAGCIISLTADHKKIIEHCLAEKVGQTPAHIGDLRHSLALCGQFKLQSCSNHLAELIREKHSLLCEAITSAGLIEDTVIVPELARLIRSCYDLEARRQEAISAQPVFEEDRDTALIYWTALKALGNLPHTEAVEILLVAVDDYAPDKREQALLSLQKLCLRSEIKLPENTDLSAIVKSHLLDPASSVRIAALTGVEQHGLVTLLPETIKLLHAREISVQRKAAETITGLASKTDNVIKELEESAAKELDSLRKDRLLELTRKLKSPSPLSR